MGTFDDWAVADPHQLQPELAAEVERDHGDVVVRLGYDFA
jgi:hypothetical protein